MNRLQKKCVIAIAGTHLLLLTILIVGPAFFNQQPKADNTQILEMIPPILIDGPNISGVKNATPPPPAPQIVQPQPPAPQPQQQTPPPKPEPIPAPSLMARVEKFFKPEPAKPTLPETQPHKIQPNLTPTVRTAPNNIANPRDARAINKAIKSLKTNLKPSTEINLSGASSVAYANYGDVVVNVYRNAWVPPDGMAGDNVTVKIKVTILKDGTVKSASIETPSGDANVDRAVQRMLDRVTVIAPFPEGTTDEERTYPINFNATHTTE